MGKNKAKKAARKAKKSAEEVVTGGEARMVDAETNGGQDVEEGIQTSDEREEELDENDMTLGSTELAGETAGGTQDEMLDKTTLTESEGPTLPILGQKPFADPTLLSTPQPLPSTKRKRANNDVDDLERPVKSLAKHNKQRNPQHPPQENGIWQSLNRPWDFLPAAVREKIQTRCGVGVWGERCIPHIVMPNQNIEASVKKLSGLLCRTSGEGGEKKRTVEEQKGNQRDKNTAKDNDADGFICVIAQGKGTPKMVSVVEIAKRVLKPSSQGDQGDERRTWYFYTGLASQDEEPTNKKKKKKAKNDDKGSESEDAFEVLDREEERGEARKKVKKVPVLMVWMARSAVVELGREYGEEAVRIVGGSVDGG